VNVSVPPQSASTVPPASTMTTPLIVPHPVRNALVRMRRPLLKEWTPPSR